MSHTETKQREFLLKIAIPIVIVWGVIVIARAGYAFGQWLYDVLN